MPTKIRVSQVPIFALSAPLARHAASAPLARHAASAPPTRHAVSPPSAPSDGDVAELSSAERWNCCRISADVAAALGIPVDDLEAGEGSYQVRISVTEADVNVLFNPGYLEFLGKSDCFVACGLASGSHRVEIHPNSGPGAKDGGVFKLFGGGNPFSGTRIPTNARVTLWIEELAVVQDRIETRVGQAETPVSRTETQACPADVPSPVAEKALDRQPGPGMVADAVDVKGRESAASPVARWLLALPLF